MHRVDTDGNIAGAFTDGNPSIGQPATRVGQDILNALQEELVGVVLASGLTLIKADNTQLLQALDLIFDGQLQGGGIDPGGRLSLTTGVPVTTADVAGATTVYYTPHKHNRIRVYDGTRWILYTLTELSQLTTDATKSPAAVANNSNYDVFVWFDTGTFRATRGPAWTSDTARGSGAGTTELESFGGRWVNKQAITNGPAARRGVYVGTIRSDGSAQINDKLTKRHVWNAYNRVNRAMRAVDATATWVYGTATIRQANNSAANQLDYVQGLAEDPVICKAHGASIDLNTSGLIATGVGLDQTAVDNSVLKKTRVANAATADPQHHEATYEGFPGIGRHFLAWLERGSGNLNAAGNTTFWGTNGSIAGISGVIPG